MSSSWILENQSRSGGFGIVSVWIHKENESRLAVKKCRLGRSLSKNLREQWINEVAILGQLNHPNVIKSFPPPADFKDKEEDSSLPLLFMEYCSGGDLRVTLNQCQNATGLQEVQVLAIISDLTSALGYLHNRRIIHRDLKPENVVLHLEKGRVIYKLIDLGYAKKLDQSSLAQTIVGTLQYLAPEFYMGNKYNKSVDYWSLGLITHEIVTGLRPFLPEYPPGKWMEVVENKHRETICIPELNDERAEFFLENHISESLQRDVAHWLQSLLEWDAHLRGKNEVSDEITVFSELNTILNRSRIKIVFLDNSLNKMDFVVENESSVDGLCELVEKRVHIPKMCQILLTRNGNRLLSLEPFLKEKELGQPLRATVYVADTRIVTDIEKKISSYGIIIPDAVKSALKSPKEKVDFKTKRRIYAHGYYLLRQEEANHENSVLGTRILIVHLLNELKILNSSSQGLVKLFEKAVSKFDLFKESLNYDIEKYKEQAQRRQRITSAKIYDSWSNPDPHLEKQLKSIQKDVALFEKEIMNINQEIRNLQKSSRFQVDSSPDMKEFCIKSLNLCESLKKFSPSNGRPTESSNVVEMARLIVICLKRRDEILRKHFTLLNQVLTHVNAISSLMPKIEVSKNKLEIFLVAVSKSQRKRQSDVWKLLAAALQLSPSENSSTPSTASPSSSSGMGMFSNVDETLGLIGENRIFRSNMQKALDSASDSLDKFNQLISMEYMNGSNGPEGISEDFTETEYDGDLMYMPQNEYKLANSVVGDGTHKDREIGISTLAFDQHEELLWMGSRSGHVTSYYGMQFQKYTSFQVHPRDHIRNITTTEQSVLILTNTTLRGQHRRGIPQFNYSSKNMVDMHSLIFNNRTQRVLMSGMQESLIEYDIGSGKQVSAVNTEGSCALLRNHPRFICCGDVPHGKIQLRDPRSLKLAHSLDAHTGTLSDFDVHGHHLITCGQSLRHGIEQPDRFLMVYDMRILRAISPIQSMVVPYQLRFLPSMTSQIAIMSANGQVQIADTACLATPNISMFQVEFNLEGLNTISMDISPSNQCLAFGDTGNTIYLYSSYANPVLNPYSRATEFADPVEQLPAMSIDDEFAVYSSVPRPHLPPGTNSYLSDLWPDKFCRNAYRATPEINPEIIRSMKIIGTVGYARNVTNMKRNLVAYPNVKKQGRCDNPTISSSSSTFNTGREKKVHDHDTSSFSLIPKRYRKVVVKYSKLGVEDFDFDRYNRTGFCGLEATLPNAYSNAMLQILYFIEDFHKMVLNHVCTRETCLACELSFLFHMMNHSSGAPCQSSNFLRSLRTIPEASALGIVLSDENGIKKCNVPRLIQSWNRFILQQTHVQCNLPPQSNNNNNNNNKSIDKATSHTSSPSRSKNDSGNSPSIVSHLFGFKQDKINYCTRCKSNVTSSDLLQVVNMVYPEQTSSDPPVLTKFEKIVCSSLCPEQTTPAWCDKCRKYQPTNITRVVRSLPKILNLNAGCDNPQDINYWRTQVELTYKLHKSVSPDNGDDSQDNINPDLIEKDVKLGTLVEGVKQCRYGTNCNRQPDCKFWHPENNDDKMSNADFGDRLFNEDISWIPFNFTLNRYEDGTISYDINETDSPVVESLTYDLYAVCCNIVEPSTNEHNNLVACINIGPYFHSKIASPVSQWYILNDFSISTISPQEAVWFNLSWKVPCILVFQSRSEVKNEIPFINPITTDVFNEGRSLSTRRDGQKRITFIPLDSEEMLGPGDLTAIDAEFVTLNQEESELRSDGKVSLLKAAHVSVARITVVRGNGPLEGTPFIDDYISTQEQVVDYVTKFSGIKPGDLDANSSSKHLTTLKATYLKLRYLVDIGVIFVGHGLKNDFRVINIVVPPEQIVDTVHLFHLPHNRMVSLKFLAWFFLKIKIQGDTHDSVEDAVTALSLYKKYLKLKKDKQFISALNALYEKGKELNWKIPEDAA